MREVCVFYAYDDTEFYTREECLAYEEKALKLMEEINEKYSFFDENMNLFVAPLGSTDIEEWIDWLNTAANKCTFIHRTGDLSVNADKFCREVSGYCINNSDFPYGEENIGWFKYEDYDWVKVDEQSTLFIFCKLDSPGILIKIELTTIFDGRRRGLFFFF